MNFIQENFLIDHKEDVMNFIDFSDCFYQLNMAFLSKYKIEANNFYCFINFNQKTGFNVEHCSEINNPTIKSLAKKYQKYVINEINQHPFMKKNQFYDDYSIEVEIDSFVKIYQHFIPLDFFSAFLEKILNLNPFRVAIYVTKQNKIICTDNTEYDDFAFYVEFKKEGKETYDVLKELMNNVQKFIKFFNY